MRVEVNKKIFKYIFVICIALLGAFMFHVSPDDNMDFVRYQDILHSIRTSQISFLDFWLNGTQVSRQAGAAQKYAYSENILIYLIAKYFNNDYILVWCSILIDYVCIAYIAFDLKYYSKYSVLQVIVSILLCFAELPFIHACSGLRTATAACVMAVGLYDYLYKQCRIFHFGILGALAIGFHPFVLFAIVIALTIKLLKNNIAIIGVIVGIILLPQITKLFMNSHVPFLILLAQKYITYTSDKQFRAYRTFQYGTILISALCIIYVLYDCRKRKKNPKEVDTPKSLKMFFIAYMFVIIGNIESYELVVRSGYLIGAMAPLFSMLVFNYRCRKDDYICFSIRFSIILLAIVMCIAYVRYYYRWFII